MTTVDSVEDMRVLSAISLLSMGAMTSFIGLVRISFIPSTSKWMSVSDRPFSKRLRITLSV